MGRVQNSSGSGWGLAWDFGSGFIGFQLLDKFRVWSGSGSNLKSTFGFGIKSFGFSGFSGFKKYQILEGKMASFSEICEIIVKDFIWIFKI